MAPATLAYDLTLVVRPIVCTSRCCACQYLLTSSFQPTAKLQDSCSQDVTSVDIPRAEMNASERPNNLKASVGRAVRSPITIKLQVQLNYLRTVKWYDKSTCRHLVQSCSTAKKGTNRESNFNAFTSHRPRTCAAACPLSLSLFAVHSSRELGTSQLLGHFSNLSGLLNTTLLLR
jgi:hypothetical protein